MPLALDRVHVYARHESPTGEVEQRLVEFNPFLRLSNGVESAPIYIQNGGVYGEGGDVIPLDALPDWFHHQIALCSDAALVAVGWKEAPQPVAMPMTQPPQPQYSTAKAALLARLAELSEDDLHALLSPQAAPPPAPVAEPPFNIADLDADDFPADEDELPLDTNGALLPTIPGEDTAAPAMWQCEECGEWIELRLKGNHKSHHARWRKKLEREQQQA